MKDKKILIIIAALIVLALIVVLIFVILPGRNSSPLPAPLNSYQPKFLNEAEKQAFGLPVETKVQVFQTPGVGTTYKVIRNDSEIVTDPSQVGPISPRQDLPR